MTEVILVSIGPQDTAHRRDIETEETSADGGEGADGIDVVERLLRLAMLKPYLICPRGMLTFILKRRLTVGGCSQGEWCGVGVVAPWRVCDQRFEGGRLLMWRG